MKRVGVVVPCYNYARFLGKSLDSIFNQSYGSGNLQVIVVDDGSTDHTAEVAADYPVEYVYRENQGVCAALNTGLARVSSPDYIAINSADDEWTPGRLARQVEAMEGDPRIGLLYGGIELIDEKRMPLGHLGVPDTPVTQREAIDRLMVMNFVSGGTTLTRATMLPLIWPIPGFACYEDWWMAVRIASLSSRSWPTIARLPDPAVLRYRQHGANMTAAPPEVSWGREIEFRRWLLTSGPWRLASAAARTCAQEKLDYMEQHGQC